MRASVGLHVGLGARAVWSKFKARRAEETTSAKTSLSEGLRIYAVGDIHGCASLLDRVADAIAADVEAHAPEEALAVFIGDYVDRGPDSAGVLNRLTSGRIPVPLVPLRGNHEQMLLNFLDDATVLDAWRRFGGLETLHSFGIDVSGLLDEAAFERARTQLSAVLPSAIRNFLSDLPSSYSEGSYYFCHAGVRPGVPLDAQRDQDLLWIRDEFLSSTADHGKIIVHGHTPVEAPEFHPNRINIDTGAYLTGVLTCLVLEGTTRRLLTS